MQEFKIRCSAIGTLMAGKIGLSDKQIARVAELNARKVDAANGVDKVKPLTANMQAELEQLSHRLQNPELPQGAKTYVRKWFMEQVYGRRKQFTSKYTDKGLIMEDWSIDFLSDMLGMGMLIKNEERKENDFMTGECDVLIPEEIFDVKNSWDFSTFPLLETECPNESYWWQAQGYMELYDRPRYKLIYVLSDTPKHLIEKEARWYCVDNGYQPDDKQIYEEFKQRMTYDDIDPSLKIKVFPFERDKKAMEQVAYRVKLARKYINDELMATLPA